MTKEISVFPFILRIFDYLCTVKLNDLFEMKRLLLALFVGFSLSAGAQTDDPNFARAEKMFTYVRSNQTDSLYANLSDKVKGMVQKSQLEGVFAKAEQMAGKYQNHSPWEVQTMMGQKAYVSAVKFESAELGVLVIFDTDGKMMGIQLVPVDAIKKA